MPKPILKWVGGKRQLLADIKRNLPTKYNSYFDPLSTLYSFGTILPVLAVTARRLHDTNHSAWWILIYFLPIVGFIVIIIFAATKGDEGENRFGPDPQKSGAKLEPESKSTRKATTTRKPATTRKAATTRKPAATRKPATTRKPAATRKPATTRKPRSTSSS